MNALVGERLSITSAKVQTTRHRIMGFLNTDDYQVVFSDTPGIIEPQYGLQKAMMGFVESSFQDADIFLLVTEPAAESPAEKILERLNKAGVPVLILINKMDLSDQEGIEKAVSEWHERIPTAEILPVSALLKANTDLVLKKIITLLPESPPYFPKDEMTDKSMRFFVAEIIREKIMLNYTKEIPYSVEVVVEEFKEEENITRISAMIYTMSESKKQIIIGKGGLALKAVGTAARKDIEAFIGQKVFMSMSVKVRKDWRDDEGALDRFGYLPK